MLDLIENADRIQKFLNQHAQSFCFIGGLAVQHWGEPRMTRDIDLSLLTGFGREEPVVDLLLTQFATRIESARDFALRNRVLLMQTTDGVGIDIALAARPFEEEAINRATMVPYTKQVSLLVCSAEDLIIMKAFANRPIDWQDIRGVLVRQGTDKLDKEYAFQNLKPLADAKENPEIMERLRILWDEVAASS